MRTVISLSYLGARFNSTNAANSGGNLATGGGDAVGDAGGVTGTCGGDAEFGSRGDGSVSSERAIGRLLFNGNTRLAWSDGRRRSGPGRGVYLILS